MYLRTLSKKYKQSISDPRFQASQVRNTIDSIALLSWDEHCVECSAPHCYHHCEFYRSRLDGTCVRLEGGIQKVNGIDGPLGYGVRCEFRKWAKLETKYSGLFLSPKKARRMDCFWHHFGKVSLGLAKAFKWIDPSMKPYGFYLYLRDRYISNQKPNATKADTFFINSYLEGKELVPLLIQINSAERVLFSKIEQLHKGENNISISIDFDIPSGSRIIISPIDETNTILYFRWLDILSTKKTDTSHAAKVKVVAWDLDNTLWQGTLVNQETLSVNAKAVETIKQLDERGILNTIVSKNDESEALSQLKAFGLMDYFVCPAINWGQKSENLKHIAQSLNLDLNAFAFIDDNIREQDEVAQALPSVRVFSEKEIDRLLERSEFDVPITEVSRNRRKLYQQEALRKTAEESFSDDYDAFLRSLCMQLKREEITKKNKERCYELLNRSNQLNLSTNRYSREEYDELLQDDSYLCYAYRVIDRFGDYGIVAFLSIHIINQQACIEDFVISCRIAKKKVEQAIITSLKTILLDRDIHSIDAVLKVTKKNSPLMEVFSQLPFDIIKKNEEIIHYRLNNIDSLQDSRIIQIEDR